MHFRGSKRCHRFAKQQDLLRSTGGYPPVYSAGNVLRGEIRELLVVLLDHETHGCEVTNAHGGRMTGEVLLFPPQVTSSTKFRSNRSLFQSPPSVGARSQAQP